MKPYLVALGLSLVISWILTPAVKKLAFHLGAVDRPNARKVHHRIMPRMGGLAIFIGFMTAALTTLELTTDVIGILLGGAAIAAVGMVDDMIQLSAKVKLVGQIVAALIPVLFGVRIEWLNNPWGGYFYLDYLSVPFTVFWIVSLTNVVNLIDGLDGLAAGVSAIASVTVIMVALQQGMYPVAIMTASLAGAIIGFIRYNFNPATIFMGDTGSLFLGYMLAAISIFGAVKSAATIALLVPAIALGLPIMDTAFAFCVAIKMAGPFFSPTKVTSTIGSLLWALVSVRLLFSCISSVQGFALRRTAYRSGRGLCPCPSGRTHYHHLHWCQENRHPEGSLE